TGEGLPPEGVAMFRLKTSGREGALAAFPKGARHDAREPHVQWSGGKVEGKLEYELYSPRLDKSEKEPDELEELPWKAAAVLEGVYRGQQITPTMPIHLHIGADTIVRHRPPPPVAKIAARADEDVPLGTLTIVLDCSGSMGPKLEARYGQAIKILEAVLKKLRKGTRLSIWVFGQKGRKKEEAEPILAPVDWDPGNAQQTANLMRLLRNLEPEGFSPIVDAMVKAKKDLVGKQGFKTLLVLTDGEDSEYRKDLKGPPREAAIAKKIRSEFEDEAEGIVVSMILFQNDKDEIERAERQFKTVIEDLFWKGGFYPAGDPRELTRLLEDLMRPRLRLLRNGNRVKGVPAQGFKIHFHDETGDPWPTVGLEPGENIVYQALVQNVNQDVLLDRGDCMMLRLRPDRSRPSGIRIDRALLADLFVKDKRRVADDGDWRLAVPQNRDDLTRGRRALDLLVSVENSRDA